MNSEQLIKEANVLSKLGRTIGYWKVPGKITPKISKLEFTHYIPNKDKIITDLKQWNLTKLVLTTTNSKVNLISVKGYITPSGQMHISGVFMDGKPGNYSTKFHIQIIIDSKKSKVICGSTDAEHNEIAKGTYVYDDVRAANTGIAGDSLSNDFESIITQFIKEYDL